MGRTIFDIEAEDLLELADSMPAVNRSKAFAAMDKLQKPNFNQGQ